MKTTARSGRDVRLADIVGPLRGDISATGVSGCVLYIPHLPWLLDTDFLHLLKMLIFGKFAFEGDRKGGGNNKRQQDPLLMVSPNRKSRPCLLEK